MNCKVEVISKVFGNYKKGDGLMMEESTAKACEKKGVVKMFSEGDYQNPKKEKSNKKEKSE